MANKKGTSSCPRPGKARILTEIAQIFINFGVVQARMAKLAAGGGQHRYPLAVSRLQRRIRLDVDDLQPEALASLQRAQTRDHVIAEVAPQAAVNGQPGRALVQLLDAKRNVE